LRMGDDDPGGIADQQITPLAARGLAGVAQLYVGEAVAEEGAAAEDKEQAGAPHLRALPGARAAMIPPVEGRGLMSVVRYNIGVQAALKGSRGAPSGQPRPG